MTKKLYLTSHIFAPRPGDELYGRKRPQEVNPLLTHNAALTLRMCDHRRRPLLAFDFFAHLLLIHIGFRQSCEGINVLAMSFMVESDLRK